jgi:phosphoglycerate kinase
MKLDVPALADLALGGKRVLVRVDFNVPLHEGRITDDTRIRAALPTIAHVLAAGGIPILMSHLGRPKGLDETQRLGPIAARLAELLGRPVKKLDETVGPAVREAIRTARAGDVLLLENVRFLPGETKGDPALSAELAALGDVFVNDAFGSSHRDHCSVAGVARLLPSAAGLLLERELAAFARVLTRPERPFVAVLGGAKVSDKLPVIENLLPKVDALVVGGGMAYTFLAVQGLGVGQSLLQEDQKELVQGCIQRARQAGKKILLPADHVIAERFAADSPARVVSGAIPAGWMGLDIGPAARTAFAAEIRAARTVVWNGPMGVFEFPAFRAGTEAVGRAVAECQGYTVVGGGDSVAAVTMLGLADKIGHISTGGGASLELLEGQDLPGIRALAR